MTAKRVVTALLWIVGAIVVIGEVSAGVDEWRTIQAARVERHHG